MRGDVENKGIPVTIAATCINLALGVLYSWSIFKVAILQSIEKGGVGAFDWSLVSLNDPYAVCCMVFAFSMILAGHCQDRFGPRLTAVTGGILVGVGFVWVSQTTSYWSWILGFGGFVGMGIAFGYSAATPPALKWFPPNKSGKIAGIVVAGFGLASVYIAPLSQYLLDGIGLSQTMFFFGIAFMVIVSSCALFLVNPPPSYKPTGIVDTASCTAVLRNRCATEVDHNRSPFEMMQTPSFWKVWVLYFIGAGAGLMVIGNVAGMAKASLGHNAFLAVAFLAIGNAGGRVVAGIMSDKFGRCNTLGLFFALQAMMMFGAAAYITPDASNAIMLVLLTSCIGFNYGTNLALFPTFTRDLWGMKHFGVNYGLIFSAWGMGGFVMSRLSQVLKSSTGSFTSSFLAAGVLLLGGVLLMALTRNRVKLTRSN
ncbi:MAG: OFA family MFS transporter [Desulfobulbaceae bacterium]|jgi:OFA family oxalate/formate antiporter-like MFS transporter|nr:OFA family MFS transporter [Desulfobulbaceae bacterium]